MNWKRFLPAGLIVLVTVVTIIGAFKTPEEKKVGITVHDLSDSATREYTDMLCDRLTEEGYGVTVADAENDQALQNQQIQNWIEEKYDAVIISPVMVSAVSETIDVAKQGKMPVVLIGKEIPDDALAVYDRAAYVGNPPAQWGKLGAAFLLQCEHWGDMNGDGTISYLLVQDNPENAQKQSGTDSLLQTLQDEKKTLKEIRQITTGGDQAEGSTLCAQSIAQFGKDIEVVICDSDAGVLGADQAIQDGGRKAGKDIYLITMADTQQTLKEVAAGNISAAIHRDFASLSEKTVDTLNLLVNKKSYETVNLIDYVTVTPENATDYIIAE